MPHFSFKEYMAALTLRQPEDRLLCTIIAHYCLLKLGVRPPFMNSCNAALQFYQNPNSRCKKLVYLQNFKEFSELPLSGRNQVFAQLLNTFYCDATQKFGDNERDGVDIDHYFSLGIDFEGNEWYLVYPDFIVCVGKNLGGKKFDLILDEERPETNSLRDWMVENAFMSYVSNSVGLPIDIEENFQKSRESYFYMNCDNVTFQQLEPEDDAPPELSNLQFCKNTFPIDHFVKLLQKSTYKAVIESITEVDGQLVIDDLFTHNYVPKKQSTKNQKKSEESHSNSKDYEQSSQQSEENNSGEVSEASQESYSGHSYSSHQSVIIKPTEEEKRFASILKKFRISQQQVLHDEFIEFSKHYKLDQDTLKQSISRTNFLIQTQVPVLSLINNNFIKFLPLITQKQLSTFKIDKSLPISIIHLNKNHKFLNTIIQQLQFQAIHIVLNLLKNKYPMNLILQTKPTLSAKNFHSYRDNFVNLLDEVFSVIQGLSQFYYDYGIANQACLEDIRDVSSNFVEDIAAEGEFGQWEVKNVKTEETQVVVTCYQRTRELSAMARVFTDIVNSMPDFLKNKQFIPKSQELSQLRIYLGYEAPPRVKTPEISQSSESSEVVQDNIIKRNEKRGYDFSDSSHSAYNLESTSEPSQYSDPSSSNSEYIEYTIFPDGTKSEIKYVTAPFENEVTEFRDFTVPFLVRKLRSIHEKELRKEERNRKAQIKQSAQKLKSGSRPEKNKQYGRRYIVNQNDVNKYEKLKEIQERQRVEMERYKARIGNRGIVKQQYGQNYVPDITIDRKTHPNVNLMIPKIKDDLNFNIPSIEIQPAEKENIPEDMPQMKFDFNFDLK
eukprot:EST46444.1 Hypothetical protein SS50377_13528 [Spironucleus salmonicida]